MDAPNIIPLKHQNIPRTLRLPLGLETAVHRLPVEILIEIFLFYLPPGRTLGRSLRVSASRRQAPLLLCHVCSSWRRIALQTPALWACLIMEVSGEDTQEVPERHSQVASHWFSQAGRHLVNLEIVDDIDHNGPSGRYSANFMMQLVRPHVEKIRSLRLSFWDNYDICCLLQHQDDDGSFVEQVWSFPNLEYLTLELNTFRVEGAVVTAFRSMPKLRTFVLEVRNDTILSNQLNIHLPWSQLTSSTIDGIDQFAFRILITQCLVLETGCFGITGRAEEEPPTVDILTLTRLTTLKVHFYGESSPRVFDGIHLPALDDFTLFLWYSVDDFIWIAPPHMFRQLGSITTLSLGERIAAPDMINILRGTTNVTVFKVQVEDGHREVFKALTLTGGSENEEILLPKLGVMYVRTSPGRRCGSEPFAVAAFVEMVASRSPGGVRPLGVSQLRDICVCILGEDPNTLKADMDAVLEQWGHKRDMPQVQYEERKWYEDPWSSLRCDG